MNTANNREKPIKLDVSNRRRRTAVWIAVILALFSGITTPARADLGLGEVAGIAYTIFDYLYSKIIGSITFYDISCIEDYRYVYYGYYKNRYFRSSNHYYMDVAGKGVYETITYLPDGSYLRSTNPFPIEAVSRRDFRCDQSTVGVDGQPLLNVFNNLEDFQFCVSNVVTAETGVLAHRGPFPARVVFQIAPLLKNCNQMESSFPDSDGINVSVPKGQTVHGLRGRWMDRQYTWPPEVRLNDPLGDR